MFKRIKGFIRMKREQRELRKRMSKETYERLSGILDKLEKIECMAEEGFMKEVESNGHYNTYFKTIYTDVLDIEKQLDDIMHAPKRP